MEMFPDPSHELDVSRPCQGLQVAPEVHTACEAVF